MLVNPGDQRHPWGAGSRDTPTSRISEGAAFGLGVQFIQHKLLTIACLHELGWSGTTQCKVGRVHIRPGCSEATQYIGRCECDARGRSARSLAAVSRGWPNLA